MDSEMESEPTSTAMETSMRGNGKKERKTEREHSKPSRGTNIKESGPKMQHTGGVFRLGTSERGISMRVSSSKVPEVVKENTFMRMETYTMENG